MAKQIKVIKCPQCGNSKPLLIGEDRYKCDKCGTEFFLDSDDINININHRHEPNRNTVSNTKGKVVAFVLLLLSFLFILRLCVDNKEIISSNSTIKNTPKRTIVERKKYDSTKLISIKGKGVAFCIINKNNKGLLSSNSNDRHLAQFYDIATGEVIKEQEFSTFDSRSLNVEYRTFISDSSSYVIVNETNIFKIDSENYSFNDVTTEICQRKPALNAGISSACFVKPEQGEGFKLITNLGKELYYFPASDMLYAEKAFNYMIRGKVKSLLPEAKDVTYYLFHNKESAYSSNVAQLYEVRYKFNHGAPERKIIYYSENLQHNLDEYNIISCKPITEERVYFSPQILYYDNKHILITYRPTLAIDAVYNIELLDINGKIQWTLSFENEIKIINAVSVYDGFMLQTGETTFIEISEKGNLKKEYKLL